MSEFVNPSVTWIIPEVIYQRFSDEGRFGIGKYAAVHGPVVTVKKFKPKFPPL